MNKIHEQTFHRQWYTDGKEAHEKTFNTINLENAPKLSEISLYIYQKAKMNNTILSGDEDVEQMEVISTAVGNANLENSLAICNFIVS